MENILCAANAVNMMFYFNEEKYGILPQDVKDELKVICVLYCSDVGGMISLSFDESYKLIITTMEPIDEIGAELKVKKIQSEKAELFEKLEEFAEKLDKLSAEKEKKS
ncbi:MAG: DUF6145 family protein [Eubacteriales bacterium]|nr:DUF6145 family protein [Eubacteriales bacterium]